MGELEDGSGERTDSEPTTGATPTGATRDALKFFFSEDGSFFREFLLYEIVVGIDALSRDALRTLALSLGLRQVPAPFRALVPKLDPKERKVIDNIQQLVAFFIGANDLETLDGLVNEGTGSLLLDASRNPEVRSLLTELAPNMRTFGAEIVVRLSEKVAARLVRYAADEVLGPGVRQPKQLQTTVG